MTDISIELMIPIAGLACGVVLGFTARSVRFCSLSAIESAFFGHDFQLLRLWGLGIAIAILITQFLSLNMGLDLTATPHITPSLPILPALLGGGLFGLGMSLVGTCGLGSILRFGGGDLRGLVAMIFIGVSGYMMSRGILQPLHEWLRIYGSLPLPHGWDSSLPTLLNQILGLNALEYATIASALIMASLLGVWAFISPRFRASPSRQIGGVIMGIVIGAGWYITGIMAPDNLISETVSSFSFVDPVGKTLIYLMNATGLHINFAIMSIMGTILGAYFASLKAQDFHWDSFDDAREMKRQLFGACLMGVGASLAAGCTIGQGMTGISTLSLSSILAFSSMVAGATLGVKFLIDGSFDRIPFLR